MDKIKVGVVGAGYFGQFHAEKYATTEETELVGVVDVNASRAQEIAKRYRTQAFPHHTDFFNKVQAVSIAVPTPLHYSITKDFFLKGIDVLLEKPISNSLEEADELVGLAETKDLIFQIGHLERFNGALSALEGKMSEHAKFIECQRLGSFSGRGADVNIVLDLMIHDLDILFTLVKSRVKSLQAVGVRILSPFPDMASARIEFESGCVASLTASRVSREKVRKTQVFQSEGILSIDYLFQKLSFSKIKEPLQERAVPEMTTEEIPVRKMDLLEAEIRSFVQSVRNRTPARVPGSDGKRALELALQIIQEMDEHDRRK